MLFFFCSFLVCFVCVSFLFLCACSFLFLMIITVFYAILFLGLSKSESLFLIWVSGSCFLFFWGCLLFQNVLLFLFACLFSCFVLNYNIIVFAFLLLFYCCCSLVFALVFFFNLGHLSNKQLLKSLEIPKTPKWKMQKKNRKTDI